MYRNAGVTKYNTETESKKDRKALLRSKVMKYGYVKAGAYTISGKVADVELNTEKIIEGIVKADKEGVELLVFPELCVTGYTCGDLFYSDVLLKAAESALEKIIKATEGIKMLVFVGLPFKKDGLIYNVAAAINDGKLLAFVPKTYLPNYNEFYEKRHFAPCPDKNRTVLFGEDRREIIFGKNVLFCDKDNACFKVAAELCEDLWVVAPPSLSHAISGATIIVNLSCSDETIGKAEYRRSMTAAHSAKIVGGYVYADAGSGESTTDMVFAGHNLIAENGRILNESKLFSSGLTLSEIDVSFLEYERTKLFNQRLGEDKDYARIEFSAERNGENLTRIYERTPFVPTEKTELDERASLILSMQAEGLKKRMEHTNAACLVLGLSGGLDSTLAILVAVTACKKLNRSVKDVIAVTMPCFGTTTRTYQNTIRLSKSLGVTLKKIDITKAVTRHLKDIKHKDGVYDVTYENAQARERTQVIMDVANMYGGLVVGTGDLSELALGWATYNGDHMSMYGVNASVPKTLVRHLVKYYADNSKGKLKAVLTDILDTPVSPELLPAVSDKITQKTEDIVGNYNLHDFFLYNVIRMGFSPAKTYFLAKRTFNGAFDDQTILKWLKVFVKRFFAQQFKRSCLPDGVKIGSLTLSPRGDWRMPSDAVCSLWLKELENL